MSISVKPRPDGGFRIAAAKNLEALMTINHGNVIIIARHHDEDYQVDLPIHKAAQILLGLRSEESSFETVYQGVMHISPAGPNECKIYFPLGPVQTDAYVPSNEFAAELEYIFRRYYNPTGDKPTFDEFLGEIAKE